MAVTDQEETRLAVQVASLTSAFNGLREMLQEDRKEQNRRLDLLEGDVSDIKVALGRICSVRYERDRVAGLSNKTRTALIAGAVALLSTGITIAAQQVLGG